MRRADHVGMAEQHVLGGRLLDEHVESGARNLLGIQCIDQRLLVDEAAARAVDDAHAFLGLGQVLAAEDIPRLVGQRGVQRDEVRAGQKLVEIGVE